MDSGKSGRRQWTPSLPGAQSSTVVDVSQFSPLLLPPLDPDPPTTNNQVTDSSAADGDDKNQILSRLVTHLLMLQLH